MRFACCSRGSILPGGTVCYVINQRAPINQLMNAEDKLQHYFKRDSYDFWKKKCLLEACSKCLLCTTELLWCLACDQKLPVVCSKHNFLPVQSGPVWPGQSDPIRSDPGFVNGPNQANYWFYGCQYKHLRLLRWG